MLLRLFITVLLALAACVPGEETPGHGGEIPAVEGPASQPPLHADPAAPDDEGPVVVFLGTSLTAGLGLLREEETYVSRLDEMADSAGLAFRAVNAGVSGETSAGGLRRIDWVLRQPLDALVLELGANDGLRGQSPAALESNLQEIIARTRARYPGVPVLVAGMEAPPNLGPTYTQRFREVFTALSATEGVALVPFLLEGVAGVEELNQADGIHPTAEGHLHVARTVWPYLARMLEDLDRP
jgi:acyl-CoA thioesterase-1